MTVLSVVPANRLNMNEIRSEIGSPATNLFDFKWSDHILNDIQWLRADTFSWQSGSVYEAAYEHLVSDLNSSTTTITTSYYAWDGGFDIYYTLSETPQVNDYVYTYENGSFVEYGQISSISTDTIGIDSDHNFCTRDSSSDKTISSDSGVHTETIGSYTVSYYLAEDGHKIVLPDMEETVANIYNELGVAWYYILDTDNQRFKLPRTKWGFTGLRDEVGKYIAESLPDHTHKYQHIYQRATSDNTEYGGGWTPTNRDYITGPASEYNPTYQDGAPVQERATQMYLYFYVGNYTKSAIEQTAGLNAELFNGKADVDLNNASITSSFATLLNGVGIRTVVETYQNGTSWYRVYSDSWIEQGGFVSQGASTQVTLLKPLKNSNYFVSTTPNSTTEGSYEMVISAKTTTSFTIASRGGAASLSKLWMVIGQGA